MVRQQIAGQSGAIGSDNRELPGGAVLRGPGGVICSHHSIDGARPEPIFVVPKATCLIADSLDLLPTQVDCADATARSNPFYRCF